MALRIPMDRLTWVFSWLTSSSISPVPSERASYFTVTSSRPPDSACRIQQYQFYWRTTPLHVLYCDKLHVYHVILTLYWLYTILRKYCHVMRVYRDVLRFAVRVVPFCLLRPVSVGGRTTERWAVQSSA